MRLHSLAALPATNTAFSVVLDALQLPTLALRTLFSVRVSVFSM